MAVQYTWSAIDHGPNIDIVNDAIIQYNGRNGDAAVIKTAKPIPKDCSYFYFEIQINSTKGTDGVTMGISPETPSNEDAFIFTPRQSYHFDDVIGCYVDLKSLTYFFTMNGKILCDPIKFDLKDDVLYPSVGLSLDGDRIHVNFNEENCKFNVQGKGTYHSGLLS